MEDFKNLKVWGKAHLLTLDIYDVTRTISQGGNFRTDEPDTACVCFHWSKHR